MIIFEKIRWKNFLATGNSWSEVSLNTSKTTLVLGKNGHGKSQLIDALCFVLFGKPFRKINKSQIVNSLNEKDCVVEIEFQTNGKSYKVIRGIKPNIFEIYCDGNILNQSSKTIEYQEILEKTILKMNFKSFTQIDILGSASFVPFMQLSPADRRIIIEDLLDIQVFSVMNILAKQKMQANKELFTRNKAELSSLAEKVNYIDSTLKSLKKNDKTRLEKLRKELSDLEFTYQSSLAQRHVVEEELSDAISESSSTDELKKKHSDMLSIKTKIESNKNRANKEIIFYSENDTCPTCKQAIDSGFKGTIIHETEDKIHAYDSAIKELEDKITNVLNTVSQTDQILEKIKESNQKIKMIDSKTDLIKKSIDKIKREISDVLNTNSLYTDNELLLKNTKKKIKALLSEQEKLLDERTYIEMSLNLLKDGGIKSRLIKQYIPIINKQINQYLKALDFYVEFYLDENFTEQIKSRYRDVFSYESFSQGQKARIDLALLFTWRHIAKLRNSVSTNLLIMDEAFDGSIDYDGQEDLMKILSMLDKDTNTFVISHTKENFIDKFDNVLRFEITKNFSVLKQEK